VKELKAVVLTAIVVSPDTPTRLRIGSREITGLESRETINRPPCLYSYIDLTFSTFIIVSLFLPTLFALSLFFSVCYNIDNQLMIMISGLL